MRRINLLCLEEGSRDFSEVLGTSSVRSRLSSTLLTSNRLLLTVTLLSSLLTVVQLRVTSSNGRRRSSSRCGTLLRCSSGRESLLLLLSTVSVVGLLESRVVRRNLLERLSVVTSQFSQVSLVQSESFCASFEFCKRTRSNRKAFRKGIERKGSCVDQLREDLVEVVGQLEPEESECGKRHRLTNPRDE